MRANLKNILALIIQVTILLGVVSCGDSGKTSSTKFSIFSTNSLTGSSAFPGGIFLIGHRLNDSEAFNVGITSDSAEETLNLALGEWEFYAIGWSGTSGNMTGTTRCSYSGIIDLKSAEETINFDMTIDSCKEPIAKPDGTSEMISDPAYFVGTSAAFSPLVVRACRDMSVMPAITSIGTVGACKIGEENEGVSQSYKIKLKGVFANNGVFLNNMPNPYSDCKLMDDAGADIRLPVGTVDTNGKYNSFIEPVIMAFTDTNCTQNQTNYRFEKGLLGGQQLSDFPHPYKPTATTSVDTSTNTLVLLESNTLSQVERYNDFGYGMDKVKDIISPNTVINEYATITGYTVSSADSSDLSVSGHPSNPSGGTTNNIAGFQKGDEVILLVNTDDGGATCGGFRAGMTNPFWVTEVDDGIGRIKLDRDITSIIDINSTLKKIAAPSTFASGVCSIQLIKVPHFRALNITNGKNIKPLAYDNTQESGGVLAFRVNGNMNIDTDATFSMQGSVANPWDFSSCDSSKYLCYNFLPGAWWVDSSTDGILQATVRNTFASNTATITMDTNGGFLLFKSENIEISTGIFDILLSSPGFNTLLSVDFCTTQGAIAAFPATAGKLLSTSKISCSKD